MFLPLDDSNLLVMVIDTNPFEWEHPSAPLKLNEALQHILAFMNAHLAGRHDNKLAVIASHVGVRYALARYSAFPFALVTSLILCSNT
jgi:hypothetical protein